MTHAPTPLPSGQHRATAREFVAVMFRRKWIIIGLFVVTTATVLAVAMTTPVVYSSTGRVLVKRGERESALSPYRQVFNQWEEELGSEMEIVRSYPVLERARAIVATEHPNDHLRLEPGNVEASVVGKSNVLGISYTDLDGRIARIMADAAVRAYLEYRQQDPSLSYPKVFFDTELAQLDRQIRQLEDQKRRYANETGAFNVGEQQRNQISSLSNSEQRRSELDQELAEARTEMRMMRELQANPDVDLPTLSVTHDQPFTNESALVDLKKKVLDQLAKLADLRERYTDQSPQVQTALVTLQTLRDLLKREVNARFALAQSRVDALQAKRDVLGHDITKIEGDLAGMPERQRVVDDLDRQIEQYRLRYDDLVKKVNDAKAAALTTPPSTVILLSPAGPPVAHNTRDYVRLALAPAFSLVVAIGLAFFVDGLDLTVRTSGQAEETLDLPVLAALNERRRRRTG
jgi:uncharacterized protein involved in exopolysaccharide biosynthesis